MSNPGHSLVHPRMGTALLGFLPARVKLESPRKGGGWTLEAEHVPARIEDQVTTTVDPRTGGLLQVQQTVLSVLDTTPLGAGWLVTDEATGQQYKTDAPGRQSESPFLTVTLKAVR